MNRSARATAAILVFAVGIVGIAAVLVFVFSTPEKSTNQHATTNPATTTAAPATHAAAVTGPPRTYGELLKIVYPQIATTQPLGISLDLSDAAHIVLTDPVHVCSRLDLWITRSDAEPLEKILPKANDEQTHMTRDAVVFVHWAPDERNKWHPRPVCRRDDGSFELVSPTSRTPIPTTQPYLWHRAFSWGQKIVVPTESGISLLTPGEKITELHHAFTRGPTTQPSDPPAEPQVTFDAQGIIAWMPWDAGKAGMLFESDPIRDASKPATTKVGVTDRFPMVSAVAMIAPSPDWFAGAMDVNLKENGAWVSQKSVTLYAWDSGGDDGTTYKAKDADTNPKKPTSKAATAHFVKDGVAVPVGSLVFTKQ